MDQNKFKTIAKIGLIGVAGFIVAPAIYLVIKGLVGLAIAAAVGGGIIAFAPSVSQFMTNMKYKALEAVISYEPVLTLKSRAEERWKDLEEQRTLLEKQSADLMQFKTKAENFIRAYPDEAEQWKQRVKDWESIFAFRVEKWKEARASTEQFMRTVDKAEAIYEMAVADAKLGKSFGKSKDFMSMFKEKTAFEAIDKANSQAMASLKMALLDESYVSEQIKQQDTPVHAVTYAPTGEVNLGKLLDIQDIAPENVRIKTT